MELVSQDKAFLTKIPTSFVYLSQNENVFLEMVNQRRILWKLFRVEEGQDFPWEERRRQVDIRLE